MVLFVTRCVSFKFLMYFILGTRAFANNCNDQELKTKSSHFIKEHIQAVLERSGELHRLPLIVVDIVGQW